MPASFILGGAERQQPGCVELSRHIGYLPLNALKVADRLAELLSFFGVFQCSVEGALRHAEREGGNRNASAVQHAHGIDEPLTLLTQQIFRWNGTVLENQL